MSDPSPTPPSELSDDLVELLEACPVDRLRDVSQFAEELAEYRDREDRIAEAADRDEPEERAAEMPEDVPSRATITIKEINANRYYYWQWRDGDKIRSKYKGPVEPDE